jgi:hypothetical protein
MSRNRFFYDNSCLDGASTRYDPSRQYIEYIDGQNVQYDANKQKIEYIGSKPVQYDSSGRIVYIGSTQVTHNSYAGVSRDEILHSPYEIRHFPKQPVKTAQTSDDCLAAFCAGCSIL